MSLGNRGYINDVDDLIVQTSVEQVLTYFGKSLPSKSSGEHRMPCVFNEDCVGSQYGNLTIRLNDPVNRIYCHSCGVRGNLLTLLHGLEHRRPPAGGRLRGDEFKAAVARLREIAGDMPAVTESQPVRAVHADSPAPRSVNVPLVRHVKEAARALADLHEDLIADVDEMCPDAGQYVRRRPWMTPALMREWGVGWIPGNGRSLFRKNYLVYTHRNERGEVVSFSGRDLGFEKKWTKWQRDGRPEGKKPNKHRYVSGYYRGFELYGGQASRMEEEYVQRSLAQLGVVVVEGMNDVLRMATLGVAAVGLGSNRATDAQVEKLVRFARLAGGNRVLLLPDCDDEGEAGFKDLLWKLAEQRVEVNLGCSSAMFDGQFADRQPEDISQEEWPLIVAAINM